MNFCRFCGKPVSEEASFCGVCGRALTLPDEQGQVTSLSENKGVSVEPTIAVLPVSQQFAAGSTPTIQGTPYPGHIPTLSGTPQTPGAPSLPGTPSSTSAPSAQGHAQPASEPAAMQHAPSSHPGNFSNAADAHHAGSGASHGQAVAQPITKAGVSVGVKVIVGIVVIAIVAVGSISLILHQQTGGVQVPPGVSDLMSKYYQALQQHDYATILDQYAPFTNLTINGHPCFNSQGNVPLIRQACEGQLSDTNTSEGDVSTYTIAQYKLDDPYAQVTVNAVRNGKTYQEHFTLFETSQQSWIIITIRTAG